MRQPFVAKYCGTNHCSEYLVFARRFVLVAAIWCCRWCSAVLVVQLCQSMPVQVGWSGALISVVEPMLQYTNNHLPVNESSYSTKSEALTISEVLNTLMWRWIGISLLTWRSVDRQNHIQQNDKLQICEKRKWSFTVPRRSRGLDENNRSYIFWLERSQRHVANASLISCLKLSCPRLDKFLIRRYNSLMPTPSKKENPDNNDARMMMVANQLSYSIPFLIPDHGATYPPWWPWTCSHKP